MKQNTQNLHYKFPLNSNSGIFNKNGPLVSNRGRKGRGGRYKNDFKNSFLFKNVHNKDNITNNNLNGTLHVNNEVNNTDYSDNFEANAADNNGNKVKDEAEKNTPLLEGKDRNGFGEIKTLGRRRKTSFKDLTDQKADLNLSLNEDSEEIKNNNNSIQNENAENIVIKKPRGRRRKIIKTEDNLKFTLEIPLSDIGVIKGNKNILFYDLNKVVILKECLNTTTDDDYDRFIIEKNKLEEDVLEYFS